MNPQKGESVLKDDNKPADKTQDLFDIKQASEFLGVSVRTLKYWRKSGKLVPDTKGKHGRGKKSKYSLTQLKKVQNSRYEHSEKGAKFEPKNAASQEKGDKFADDQPKKVQNSEPNLTYVDEESEKLVQSAKFVSPPTLYSPKDKVSNKLWTNSFNCNEDIAIITIRKSEEFGCIVRLNYDKIFADEHVITGANFSDFDRALYDAVVTLMVAGNNIFSNTALWRVITQNPDAKLNEIAWTG